MQKRHGWGGKEERRIKYLGSNGDLGSRCQVADSHEKLSCKSGSL